MYTADGVLCYYNYYCLSLTATRGRWINAARVRRPCIRRDPRTTGHDVFSFGPFSKRFIITATVRNRSKTRAIDIRARFLIRDGGKKKFKKKLHNVNPNRYENKCVRTTCVYIRVGIAYNKLYSALRGEKKTEYFKEKLLN